MGQRSTEYRALVDDFVHWSGRYHLLLNVAKTREMVIDFRRKRTATQPLCILGEDVGVKVVGLQVPGRPHRQQTGRPTSRLYVRRG